MHSHAHHHASTGRVLGWSTVATAAFVAIEVAAGIRAHSLALVSDAGHNLTDALALLLAWFGVYLQSRPADEIGHHPALEVDPSAPVMPADPSRLGRGSIEIARQA